MYFSVASVYNNVCIWCVDSMLLQQLVCLLLQHHIFASYLFSVYVYIALVECSYVFYMHAHVYIPVPSCYVTTNCIGEPINSSITYSDCCMNFGASYDLNGRCQPCPSTSKQLQTFYTFLIYYIQFIA